MSLVCFPAFFGVLRPRLPMLFASSKVVGEDSKWSEADPCVAPVVERLAGDIGEEIEADVHGDEGRDEIPR